MSSWRDKRCRDYHGDEVTTDLRAKKYTKLRSLFPGAVHSIYMDVAARGLISLPVRAAIDAYLNQRMLEGADKAWMFEEAERTRARFASMIGAQSDEISLSKNVSDAINAFASSIPWVEGDNVVLCEALEHPANVFPWYNLKRLSGIELKIVTPQDGRIPLDRILETIDKRTRLVTVSSVSFSPGARFPVGELGDFCRKKGVYLIVDAAQSIGILETNVRALNIDALATSTQKGLLGLYGAGFLYVRQQLAETLWPRYLSRSGVAAESDHHEAASGDTSRLELARGARRFDVGNHNFLAAVAVGRSLQDLLEIGVEDVESWVCALARRLAVGLQEAGLPVYGREPDSDSHIVAVGTALTSDHDTTTDRAMLEFYSYLVRNKVKLTIRRGMLRMSLHAYNNQADVDAVVAMAQTWSKQRGSQNAQ